MGFLNQIGDWLAQAHHVYLALAVIGSTFFALQLVMMLAGGIGAESDLGEADMNADGVEVHDAAGIEGLKLFSIKGIVSFVTFFGWAGFFWGDRGWSGFFIAVGCGALMMLLTSLTLWFMLKMQQSGNVTEADIVGQYGQVYLGIGAGRSVHGTVTVKLPHCTRRIRAVAEQALPSGATVRVKESLEGGLFLVEPAEGGKQAQ